MAPTLSDNNAPGDAPSASLPTWAVITSIAMSVCVFVMLAMYYLPVNRLFLSAPSSSSLAAVRVIIRAYIHSSQSRRQRDKASHDRLEELDRVAGIQLSDKWLQRQRTSTITEEDGLESQLVWYVLAVRLTVPSSS